MKLQYVGTGRHKMPDGTTVAPPKDGDSPATVEVTAAQGAELLERDRALGVTNWKEAGPVAPLKTKTKHKAAE